MIALLGPTNTGKTYHAVERMLAHRTGMIGFPLRLLARENYDRLVQAAGAGGGGPRHRRGAHRSPRARVLRLHGGGDAARPPGRLPGRGRDPARRRPRARPRLHRPPAARARARGDDVPRRGDDQAAAAPAGAGGGVHRPRRASRPSPTPGREARRACRGAPRSSCSRWPTSTRSPSGCAARRAAPRSCSARSRRARATRRSRSTRRGEVDYLVATDAIGMGLNLDIDHVAFTGLVKFDGRGPRPLRPAEVAQIAGRAGRHTARRHLRPDRRPGAVRRATWSRRSRATASSRWTRSSGATRTSSFTSPARAPGQPRAAPARARSSCACARPTTTARSPRSPPTPTSRRWPTRRRRCACCGTSARSPTSATC